MASQAADGKPRDPARRPIRSGAIGAALLALLLLPLFGGGDAAAGGTPTPGPLPASAPDDHGGHDDHAPPATPDEQAAADRLVRDTLAGTARFADPAVAFGEGYAQASPFWFGAIRATHLIAPAAVADGRLLDPKHPEGLIYLKTADGRLVYLGAMFLAPIGAGPPVAGPLLSWHAHPEACFGGGGLVPALATGRCLERTVPIPMEMAHVWVVPNRLGSFDHDLPAEDAAAASDQTVAQVRPVPLVDDAALHAAVGHVLGLAPKEIGRRFAAGDTLAGIAAGRGVARADLLGAIRDVFAAGLARAAAAGEIPPDLHRLLGRFAIAQSDALLDATAAGVDPAHPTVTDFGYPCVQVTCLAPVAAPAGER